MAKEKNKPVPVRFDLKLMETLKEEEKIDTPQQALNFLARFWEDNRPAKEGFESGLTEIGTGVKPKKAAAASKKKDRDLTASSLEAGPQESGSSGSGSAASHPSGLSGIDLSIWKAEQKEKSKA
ncbi:hypothetical protein ACX0G9_12915 [Flavitalea flava]